MMRIADCVQRCLLSRCGFILLLFVSVCRADDHPTKVLLIGKEPDHPPQTHEYLQECELLAKCLRQSPGIEAVVSNGWPKDPQILENVDALVLYTAMGGDFLSDPTRKAEVERMLSRGVGLVMIHWSTGAADGAPGEWQLAHLGGWFGFSFSKIPVRDSTVHQLQPAHPISRGWKDFAMRDEYYTDLKFNPDSQPLISAAIDGSEVTVGWTFERTNASKGRSFGTVCGHFHECFANESFRRMLVNAVLWSAHREVPEQGAPCEVSADDLKLPPDPRDEPKAVDDRSWSDPNLTVREGLALWIDAQAQPKAYAAHALALPHHGEAIGICFDGSGTGRHLRQRHAESQPTYLDRKGQAAVRFDGRDDSLENLAMALECENATIFLVAAPLSNEGGFRGLLSLNRIGLRDYESGLTIDLGPLPSDRFNTLNVEGQGFGGAPNLMTEAYPFGNVHILETVLSAGQGGVQCAIDEQPQKSRDRASVRVNAHELTLGARHYSNEARPGYLQGFLDGAIAEVLLFDRALDTAERDKVRTYLRTKHAGLDEALHSRHSSHEPTSVQMLVPGFEAYRLPVALKNLNNVRYRDDGKLVALGYDGKIFLLKDTNNDGLEDQADLFWDGAGSLRSPIGMALTPVGDPRGHGVYVTSKGKVSLIIDRDGDDRADEEVILAQGWAELPHGVDALGVAVDRQGAVYFGLGAADFTNAYLLDAQGRSHYQPASDRGTIQRVSPDGKQREIVATGIRFPVAIEFNHEGDLFCTDQEGATWLPNGNPFDELLFIREGRHYGFPPRHSRHLPTVVDEPSVFDYSPQHQSTCGFVFNEPVNGGPVFGPAWWRGNAMVCGYSRGKLFRTELLKRDGEFFARNQVIAVFDCMPADCCVAPDSSLVVAAHSGQPDWGSGPDGPGHLFKLRYEHPELPQLQQASARSSQLLSLEFDRPLDGPLCEQLVPGATIVSGQSVRAGDDYEKVRPGYAVVAAQLVEPRQTWISPVKRAADDDQCLEIETTDLLDATSLRVALPWPRPAQSQAESPHRVPQNSEVEFDLSLTGVFASISAGPPHERGRTGERTLILPHADLAVARGFTSGTAAERTFWPELAHAGYLTLRGQLRLENLLHPAVQPGSSVDNGLPAEEPEIVWEGARPLQLSSRNQRLTSVPAGPDRHVLVWKPQRPHDLVPYEVEMETGQTSALSVRFRTQDDARLRPLSLWRFVLPWVRLPVAGPRTRPALPMHLADGDARRGELVFNGEKARCARCHSVRGVGGNIGPDLTNLIERDYDSVLRDIKSPSAALNPDYLTYSLALKDGLVLSGTVRSDFGFLIVGDGSGNLTRVPRDQVDEMRASSLSIMPEGLLQELSDEEQRDLLTFLLTLPSSNQRCDDAPALQIPQTEKR